MPPMKPPQSPSGAQNPNGLSNWLNDISKAGAAQDRERRKVRASQRSKSLVDMVEELKKRPKR